MALAPHTPAARRRGLAIGLGIAIATATAIATAAAPIEAPTAGELPDCGVRSPAFPVPEFVGSTRLWPTNGFRPARPGQQLPASRDSTQYISQSYPSALNGHELFWALDIVGDRVFVMYNVGISVWDISGANAENPLKITHKDGIAGQWFVPQLTGEPDGFVNDIAAIQDPANPDRIHVALAADAAEGSVGTTLWYFDRSSGTLTQTFQQTELGSEEVELVDSGGRVYAIFAATRGTFVLDVSAASSLPQGCLDGACPAGINLGQVGGSPGGAARSRHIGLIKRDGKVYVMTTNGEVTPFAPPVEIWELDPAVPAAAARRFDARLIDSNAPVLFLKDGLYYAAMVQDRRIKIFNVTSCLDSDGCTTLGSPLFQDQLRPNLWIDYLTYSVSEGTPFLYYGMEALLQYGPAIERLYDLSNLGGSNQISEITATGQTYTDPCNGLGPIGYWASYYEFNDLGYRNFNPRKGKFAGRYFYRVTHATFDVHERTVIVQNPTVTTAATTPAPHYFGDNVSFTASALNCSGPETFSWHATNTGASGLGSTTGTATLNWPLCGDHRCPDEEIEVWAIKAACSGAPNLTLNRATVTVQEPRPQIASISVAPSSAIPDTYPLCSQLGFTADVSGKAPLGHAWRVRNGAGEQIAQGNSAGFTWNTDGVILELPTEIFYDGFESGDVGAWNLLPAPPNPDLAAQQAAAQQVVDEVMGAGSAVFEVELTVSNSTGSPASLTRDITLTALGELGYSGTPIVATSLGGGQYRFRTNTVNATRWRWEFEDPGNGTTAGCQFFTKCRILDYGVEDNDVTTAWTSPNLDGTYRVRVEAANCLTSVTPIVAELPVAVTGIPAGLPPAIATFSIVPGGHCSLSLPVMECDLQPISFSASHTGTATHYDFDWEGDGAFEESIPVGNPIAHTYPTAGARSPKVRARNGAGAPSSAVGLPWLLVILP
jgi:hypothetical protein